MIQRLKPIDVSKFSLQGIDNFAKRYELTLEIKGHKAYLFVPMDFNEHFIRGDDR